MDRPIYHLEGVVRTRAAEDMTDFVGPLDLILHLLSKHKIEIRDITITRILDQYLAWIEQRKQLDLEIASDFIAMASHLLLIKTKTMLAADDKEALSEMEALIASLEARKRQEEYDRIQQLLPLLEARYLQGRDRLAKPPEPISPQQTRQYVHMPEDLSRTLQNLQSRAGARLPPPMTAFQGIVGREPYPVAVKAKELIHILLRTGTMSFLALFRSSKSRSELVATFLSVLELCKTRRIRLSSQDENPDVSCAEDA